MAIFKILNESDLRRTEILWSLYTEEEKKSKIGMIIGAIKRIILAILKFIRDKWNKFAAKHRSNKIVASADRLFKGIASKFVKTNNRINSGNANEKEIEKMYEEVKEDSTKVQETSEKVVNIVTKEENKNDHSEEESMEIYNNEGDFSKHPDYENIKNALKYLESEAKNKSYVELYRQIRIIKETVNLLINNKKYFKKAFATNITDLETFYFNSCTSVIVATSNCINLLKKINSNQISPDEVRKSSDNLDVLQSINSILRSGKINRL